MQNDMHAREGEREGEGRREGGMDRQTAGSGGHEEKVTEV